MIVEKKISELSIGHYVVDVVEQQGQYVLSHPGHVKNESVIKNLVSKGVLTLLIDTSKTLVLDEPNETLSTPPEKKIKESQDKSNNSTANTAIILEITKARNLFNQSKSIQKKVFEDAFLGKELDLSPIVDITDKTIEAIFKNPDALACIINIRAKDEYLLEHSVSVSILMTIFARHLNIEKQIIQQLALGAFLHDVGKIMIPDEILNKPGKLTVEEFELMKSHVNHSIDIISGTAGVSELSLEVAALHHEKLNGSGYPYQIQSQEISQYGRMVTICDIFDALTANRVYKDGYCHIKAFNILRKLGQEEQLDLGLVDQFIKCMGVYPIGSLVELNSNRLAIVEGRNQSDPVKPKVRSFFNVEHNHYVMAKDIDLSKDKDFIVKGVRADDFDLDMNKIVEFLLMQG